LHQRESQQRLRRTYISIDYAKLLNYDFCAPPLPIAPDAELKRSAAGPSCCCQATGWPSNSWQLKIDNLSSTSRVTGIFQLNSANSICPRVLRDDSLLRFYPSFVVSARLPNTLLFSVSSVLKLQFLHLLLSGVLTPCPHSAKIDFHALLR
jgi:hypothetical protein